MFGEKMYTHIGSLLLEAEKKEVDVCEFGSLAVGVRVRCWWGLDEG